MKDKASNLGALFFYLYSQTNTIFLLVSETFSAGITVPVLSKYPSIEQEY
jgi:hypothetical protein